MVRVCSNRSCYVPDTLHHTEKCRRLHMQKLLLICCALSVGCASAHIETGMVTQASAEAEPHVIWTRPLEVGFEMARYIEGESTTKRLFGCACGGRSSKKRAPRCR